MQREIITFGIAVILLALAIIGNSMPWIGFPLLFAAIFIVWWAGHKDYVEDLAGRLPFGLGDYLLKLLGWLDSFITQRDLAYEGHITWTVRSYDFLMQKSLRELLRTRTSDRIPPEHLSRFTRDGLMAYPHNGPAWIKPELSELVGRARWIDQGCIDPDEAVLRPGSGDHVRSADGSRLSCHGQYHAAASTCDVPGTIVMPTWCGTSSQ
jgi:hypothetical protein